MPVGNWVPSGNDGARLQGVLRGAAQQLTAAANTLLVLKNVMAQMAPAADYTTIEQYFAVATGSGVTLHDVLGTCSDALQAAGVQALIQRFA